MAKLKCERHGKRVMVFDMGEIVPTIKMVSVVHRDNGQQCDSASLTIDGEFFSPREVIDWTEDDDYVTLNFESRANNTKEEQFVWYGGELEGGYE